MFYGASFVENLSKFLYYLLLSINKGALQVKEIMEQNQSKASG